LNIEFTRFIIGCIECGWYRGIPEVCRGWPCFAGADAYPEKTNARQAGIFIWRAR
jgi:hypothetical protein